VNHPPRGAIQAYVRGDVDVPGRLLIQAHLALCPKCPRLVGEYGTLETRLPEATGGDGDRPRFEHVWAVIERTRTKARVRGVAVLPPGLAADLPDPEQWRWITLSRRLVRTALLVRDPESGSALYLSHYPPASRFPVHRHLGMEETVVIAGSYQDGERRVEAADWVTAAPGTTHAPATGAGEECWCLSRITAPGVRFRGWRRWLAWGLGHS
jgi:putative transcriptional regulator